MKKLVSFLFAIALLVCASCSTQKYCPTYSEAPDAPTQEEVEKSKI